MSEPIDDLSAVAWVHDELRRSLDAAHKALRRFGKEAEAVDGSDIDAVDPSVLRAARAQIHQGVGALELVGLPAPALVLRASEALVQRATNKPQTLTPTVIADIERASFALLDYLSRMLAGKAVSPLALFPQYRAVQDTAEANRVHPADLWSVDWRWRELPADPKALPRQAGPAVHDALESQLLALMRGTQPTAAARRIGDICAGLGAGASDPEVATLWKLASAVFEAQAEGLLGFDIFTKRVASRLLAQYRILERGESDVSERLARDLLFFSAQSAPPGAGQAPRLSAARRAYALPDDAPVDYSQSALGRFDPAVIVHAKKRVAAAKEAWSAVAGGEMHRLAGLNEQFSLVGDSLKKLFPLGDAFANELQQAVGQAQSANAAPPAPLAMEVATGLLYTEAALEDGDFDDPMHAERMARLGERLAQVRQNHPPEPLEAWMEELYRRVSNRQTMGSVVQELRASLLEAEKSIDQFFRNPADHSVLITVPQQLSAMRGVLSVLGIDHASAALLRMRDEIEALASTEVDDDRGVQPGVFDRIAGNLSALGFLIDMLSVQPQLAKSLFVYDPEAGTLSPVMGRADDSEHMSLGVAVLAPAVEPRLIEQAQLLAFSSVRDDVSLQDVTRDLDRLSHEAQAADQPALAAAVLKAQEAFERATDESDIASARGELSEALVDFVATAAEPEPIAPAPSVAPRPADLPTVEISDFQEDDEMRSVFLEEAREVITDAGAACKELARSSSDLALQTTLRRAFHTLKGSSRMVGLKDFGEAAWLCEQLYNTHLAEQRAAEPAFVEFTAWSLGYLGAWSDEIAAHGAVTHDVATVKARAEAVGRESSGEAPSDIALPFGFPPDLPSAADLDLTMPLASASMPLSAASFTSSKAAPLSAREAIAEPASADEAPAFELDLSALDAGGADAGSVGFTTAQTHLNPSVQALFDPFDAFEPAAEPLPLPDTVDVEVDLDAIASGPMDLDLGGDDVEPAFIRSLEPSRADAALAEPVPAADAFELGEASFALDLSDPDAAGAGPRHDDGAAEALGTDDELVKVVGPLRISIPLFNIYLNEADELSRRLATELAEWAMELERPVGETPIALAHSLAGSSATVGFADLSHLARALEHALTRSQAIGRGTAEEAGLFGEAAEEIRRVLHQFAAGFLRAPSADVLERLAQHELSSVARLDARTHAEEIAPDDDADALPDPSLAGEETLAFESLELRPQAKEMPEWRQAVPAASAARANPDSVETTPAEFDDAAITAPAPLDDVLELAPEALAVAADAEASQPSPMKGEELTREASQPAHEATAEIVADATALVPAASTAPAPALDFASLEAGPDAASAAASGAAPDVAHDAASDAAPNAVNNAVDDAASNETSDAPASAFGALPGRFDPLGLAELKPLGAMPQPTAPAIGAQKPVGDVEDDIDAQDAVDAELFPIFEEEGLELIPQLASHLRDWIRAPADGTKASACMRTLHTLKGGARLAGAMRLGEMAHRLETRIERILGHPPVEVADLDALQSACDALSQTMEALRRGADAAAAPTADADVAALIRPLAGRGDLAANDDGPPPTAERAGDSGAAQVAAPTHPERASEAAASAVPASAGSSDAPVASARPTEPAPATQKRPVPVAVPRAASSMRAVEASPADQTPIDWSRFATDHLARARPVERGLATSQAAVRVRVPLLDRLVNLAGEVSITRSRVESGVNQIKGSLNDLTENLERLRGQLRDIEIQGETQMTSRLEAAKAASQNFDPLEFDRFTRFQELTRMMAESVNDVGTLQRTLQRSIETTEDELVAQARMTRDLQDDLLRTRMVEFEGLSDRLYRVVRQAAKETAKQVRLDIVGGSIEIDRGVLDRMTGAFEHLLRNCVSHGIELPAERAAAGKDPVGSIVVSLAHEGNEVGIEFRDDGAGLDLDRIRRKAITQKLIEPGAEPTAAELANLIFRAGFTTVETVTELAGRGVGMDVVRSEVVAMGGRIETATEAGKGTSFRLILPLTTAVTQVVMLRCGETTVAVPSTLVETVRRATEAEIDEAYASGSFVVGDKALQFFWLGALLQISARPDETAGRSRSAVVVRSAQQRIVVHVDEIVGNQEVVVKNLGPQLSRLPGLAGMTLLASGAVALIYNPVALATLYGEGARNATLAAYRPSLSPQQPQAIEDEPPAAPLVLVVDDSLTVRRVTQRLLVREGYRVALAKDGLDALERLAEEMPRIVLSDIEMPRMDGFDLVRNIRADARWRDLPVIMITSRIAQKHREHAIELGVDHYLGKPYSEEDLLALVGRYTANPARA